jgi:hypothetical protein
MAKRRSLVSGVKGTDKSDPNKEEVFVYGETEPVNQSEPKADTSSAPILAEPIVSVPTGRSPLTTRLRSDLAQALKRASLERQLAGQTPNTVQDILELALEPWLKNHGYLK